ncbi:hypothetical protein EUX98_g7300 [Antrodiella citrinella]|uniref:Uncharacterized protein n=1 Tax=Antrodiella citrinella TaxID=2447956 RepID=A0A4S4MNU1_9APHY|nr:hypothetical protein EUX98_g7300 [Antrodiella citrinella]
MYSGNYKKGEIKSSGIGCPEQPEWEDDQEGYHDWWHRMPHSEDPYVRLKSRAEGFERHFARQDMFEDMDGIEQRDDGDMALHEELDGNKKTVSPLISTRRPFRDISRENSAPAHGRRAKEAAGLTEAEREERRANGEDSDSEEEDDEDDEDGYE